ncbi:MAG: histidine kinase [Comamonas sp.]
MDGKTGILSASAARPWAGEPPRLDLCHTGVVLRLVLAAEALVAAATLLQMPPGAGGPWLAGEWLPRWGVASAVILPVLLLWLLVGCALTTHGHDFARRHWRLWSAATGAVAGVLAAAGLQAVVAQAGLATGPGLLAYAAAALLGGGAALAVVWALLLRAQAGAPMRALAQAAELQARIQPHFLFNTLNSAIALTREQPQRAEQVLEDLSELLRAALADTRESATLASELALARRYLALEQVRFAERMAVTWTVDAQALSARVPPLLLQPLVENAVRHGVECSAAPVAIDIAVRRQAGQVCVVIANTLPVPDLGRSVRRRAGRGMALDNVRARLALLHDMEGRLEVRCQPEADGGPGRFVVTLRLPPGPGRGAASRLGARREMA